MDFDKIKADASKLGAYCARNPEIGLITAADRVFDKERRHRRPGGS